MEYDEALPFRPRRAYEKLGVNCGLADYLGADYLRAYAACKEAELESSESQNSMLEYTGFLQAVLAAPAHGASRCAGLWRPARRPSRRTTGRSTLDEVNFCWPDERILMPMNTHYR